MLNFEAAAVGRKSQAILAFEGGVKLIHIFCVSGEWFCTHLVSNCIHEQNIADRETRGWQLNEHSCSNEVGLSLF